MILTAGLYGFTVMLVLASIIRAEYKRMRRCQPIPSLLDLAPPCDLSKEIAPGRRRPERVAAALRAWSVERAESDFVALQRQAAPEVVISVQPEPEPQSLSEPEAVPERPGADSNPRFEPAIETPAETIPVMAEEPEESLSQAVAGDEEEFAPLPDAPLSQNADYYEILQISPNADSETIHRVYRIMASRFHPDNPRTGSLERFLQLREAYQTLSDPALRTDYDATHQRQQIEPLPVFWQRAFVDGIEGEMNRRLGVLSLLYQRRRTSDNSPGVSVLELERRMAFPREYLNFTLWYLRAKGYITLMEDNSDYALTGTGVDYVESRSTTNRVIRELLSAGSGFEKRSRKVIRRSTSYLPRESQRGAAPMREQNGSQASWPA
jgi:curved DNA-binding protein CbpA